MHFAQLKPRSCGFIFNGTCFSIASRVLIPITGRFFSISSFRPSFIASLIIFSNSPNVISYTSLHPAAPQERILQLTLPRRFCLFLHTLHHIALANNLCCPLPDFPKPICIRCDTCTPFDRERQLPDLVWFPFASKNPSCFPAVEISWHGNPYVIRSISFGSFFSSIFLMSPKFNGSATLWIAAYDFDAYLSISEYPINSYSASILSSAFSKAPMPEKSDNNFIFPMLPNSPVRIRQQSLDQCCKQFCNKISKQYRS